MRKLILPTGIKPGEIKFEFNVSRCETRVFYFISFFWRTCGDSAPTSQLKQQVALMIQTEGSFISLKPHLDNYLSHISLDE